MTEEMGLLAHIRECAKSDWRFYSCYTYACASEAPFPFGRVIFYVRETLTYLKLFMASAGSQPAAPTEKSCRSPAASDCGLSAGCVSRTMMHEPNGCATSARGSN